MVPNRGRKEKMKIFEKQYIAHRGLFDNESEAPENSIPAFQRAVQQGYGSELDVQLTTDWLFFMMKHCRECAGLTKSLRNVPMMS